MPSVIKTEVLLDCDDLANQHLLLQQYGERIEKLSQQDKLSKFCMDANFVWMQDFLVLWRMGQCRFGVGLAGVVACSRSRLEPDPRPLRDSTQAFSGRSKGLVIEHVSLGQATRNDTRRRCSKKAAAWRAFRRLVAQAVGSLAGWKKGRASQGTLQQSVNLLA